MSKSPGHQQHPDHKVEETAVEGNVRVAVGTQMLVDSGDVILVREDGNPPRYYFPRSAVRSELLQRSDTTSACPFKGAATYYHLVLDGKVLNDAVWSYEQPYDEHQALKGRLAFYDDKLPEIVITPKPA